MDDNRPDSRKTKIVTACDAALAVLLTWQALDTLRPVMVIATGLALGVRVLASRLK